MRYMNQDFWLKYRKYVALVTAGLYAFGMASGFVGFYLLYTNFDLATNSSPETSGTVFYNYIIGFIQGFAVFGIPFAIFVLAKNILEDNSHIGEQILSVMFLLYAIVIWYFSREIPKVTFSLGLIPFVLISVILPTLIAYRNL